MKKIIKLAVISLSILFVSVTWANPLPFSSRTDVNQFINSMVKQHGFNKTKLVKLFNKIQPNPRVVQLMNTPYEAKPWYKYQSIFVTPTKIQDGVKFWAQHQAVLNRAEQTYGVPADIIVAIIGIESRYGARQGTFPVFQTLSTLAFNYPSRAKFFRRELSQYLLLTRQFKINPLTLKGSYAGAMGQPQFMPSSYRHYAVDFAKNGHPDLFTNTTDIIGSVANYLKENGWKRNSPIYTPVKITGNKYKKIKANNLKPRFSPQQLSQFGIITQKALPKKSLFLDLKGNKNQPEFYVGFQNFYVITRYNRSPKYAMAVAQLGQKIAQARKQDNRG